MERTSVVFDKTLIKSIRQGAKRSGLSFKDFLQLLVREGLRSISTQPSKKSKFSMRTSAGGIKEGVDIADRIALSEIIDDCIMR